MPGPGPDLITRYFDADARRDTAAVVALFTADAEVVDEGQTWRGVSEIRSWRDGPASQYQYTTELYETNRTGEQEYLVTGRLEGNFPGGTADLNWHFTLDGDLIRHLHIAP